MSDSIIRVEYDPPPIPVRNYDYHAWVDGDEEWGAFHGATREEALIRPAEALAIRFYEHDCKKYAGAGK